MPSPDEEMEETGHSTKRERLDSEDLSVSRLKHTGHGSRNKRVFVDEAGAPLAFYGLPSLKRRHEYVDAIKVRTFSLPLVNSSEHLWRRNTVA